MTYWDRRYRTAVQLQADYEEALLMTYWEEVFFLILNYHRIARHGASDKFITSDQIGDRS
jgi:hypothetical protein